VKRIPAAADVSTTKWVAVSHKQESDHVLRIFSFFAQLLEEYSHHILICAVF
jgi:hypothetical protein